MLIVFVHGWSVANTDTYAGLPAALLKNAESKHSFRINHIYLSKYVSFADEVGVEDIARAMQHALVDEVLPQLAAGERFACITHSTGGPVMRHWIDLFYGDKLDQCPLGHLVMLAPANHGSALAQLGKGRIARMKFFAEGIQPGVGVLDWLELGSLQSWELNQRWLDYDCLGAGLYLFVLTGQAIDRRFYDHLNAYTDEAGSDGVVRVAATNLNYGLIRLVQQGDKLRLEKQKPSAKYAFGILPGCSHAGDTMGILGSVKPDDPGSHPSVYWILKCLTVDSKNAYQRLIKELTQLSEQTQANEHKQVERKTFLFERTFTTNRYCMLVIRIMNDRGNSLVDYDVLFTAGPHYDPNHLPPGFFVDRQRNSLHPETLTYYIDYDLMNEWLNRPQLAGKFGVLIRARPVDGFAYYRLAEHQGTFAGLKKYFEPNRTLMVDIELKRHIRSGIFQLTQDLTPENYGNQAKGVDLE